MIVLEFITIILTSIIAIYELNSNGHLDRKGKIAMGLIVFLALTNVASQIFSYKKEKKKDAEELISRQINDSLNQARFQKNLSELEEINKKLLETNKQNAELINNFISQNIKLKNISQDLSKVTYPIEPHKLQIGVKINIGEYLRTNKIKWSANLAGDKTKKALLDFLNDSKNLELKSFLFDRGYYFDFTSNYTLARLGQKGFNVPDYQIRFFGSDDYDLKILNDSIVSIIVRIDKYQSQQIGDNIKSWQDAKNCILQIHTDCIVKSNKKTRNVEHLLAKEITFDAIIMTFDDSNESQKISLLINKQELQRGYISGVSEPYYKIELINLPNTSWQNGSVSLEPYH